MLAAVFVQPSIRNLIIIPVLPVILNIVRLQYNENISDIKNIIRETQRRMNIFVILTVISG